MTPCNSLRKRWLQREDGWASFRSLPRSEQQIHIASNLGVSQWGGGGGAGNQGLKLKERMTNKERPGSERGVKGWGAIVEFFIGGHALGSAQDGVLSESLGCSLDGIYRSAGIEYWRVPKARRTLCDVLCNVDENDAKVIPVWKTPKMFSVSSNWKWQWHFLSSC